MIKIDLTTNAATDTTADNQAVIVKRLEELNKWQEEQKKLLEAKQTLQRQMLGMEQRTMYQMLGLQSDNGINNTIEQELEREECLGSNDQMELYEEESTEDSLQTSEIEEVRHNSLQKDIEHASEVPKKHVKKPFLKRGEGLKQRFKIDPEELRLNNLPKYKYANAHPIMRLKTSDKFKNTKSYKNVKNSTNGNKSQAVPATLDVQELRFQNLLISSTNTCSSTPDAKSSLATCQKLTKPTTNASPTKNIPELSSNEGRKSQTGGAYAIGWSKILDSLEIKPLQVPRNQTESLPETEESIFELLEQKAKNGSFDMDSTCLKQFMQRRITEKLNETDDNIPVQEELRNKRLEPLVTTNRKETQSSDSSEEVEEEASQLTEEQEITESEDATHKTIETTNSSYSQQPAQVRVRFSDSNETREYDEDIEFSVNESTRLSAGNTEQGGHGDSNKSELFEQFKQALFAALQIKADQYLNNDSTLNSVSDTTLTPKDSVAMYDNINSMYSPACKDLQEKTTLIKSRLLELEKEIQNFKHNNVQLMKAKQEHELEKSLNAQELLEAKERLKDEKIQMEIYLHDERVKLEDEKHQFEQNMKLKSQGLIAKERKECERLREQVSQLEIQIKTKEANHTSAQARLRTQIRNLEREQQKLHEQIENLTRENKRLENENLKISREQNNKILLEINRNIAKLAPKQIQHSSTSIPEEGPPTLGTSKTMSKCIMATATTNKNFYKAHKTTSTTLSLSKPVSNKKPTPPSSPEANRTSKQIYFNKEKSHHKQQPFTNMMQVSDEEDEEDDILKEFEIAPDKRKKTPPETQTPVPPTSPQASYNNMKREIVNADGSKDIWYPNGNLKKISADGMIIRMLYYNKDIKETNINEGTVKYYYAETNTWHTTYLDGLEILEFPNGQVEHRHKNGIVEIHYPNNSVKIMDAKDEHKQEEWRFADGTHLVQMRNGDKILSLPNGQKEIHNKLHKRREYPDGTVKIVYPDGSTETRYSNGRVRLKDKEGKLVMDTELAK